MSNRQRARATPTREEAPARLLPVMSELRKEVRAMSRDAHRIALARASGRADDYHRELCALFDSWMETNAPRVQIICFASASEFGLPMHHHAERCRAWAIQHGTDAHRALYWAALYRTRIRFGTTAQMTDRLEGEGLPGPSEYVLPLPSQVERGGRPCKRCEDLRRDARCAQGHGALRALGDMRSYRVCTGALCQTRQHQCATCGTRWTQLRSAADPFTGWTISKTVAAGEHAGKWVDVPQAVSERRAKVD